MNKNLSTREKAAYGLGAVGKDMVYMLSASYVLYYFQDIMKVDAFAMGVILLVARVFDAFNDPLMGVVVAKTKTRWGKFRPWLLIGTLTNAVILFLLFSAPPALDGSGLVAYAAVFYILWGVTYTMMDIPYWSMIPAFTEGGKEREGLTTLARSCAGVGAALISIFTMKIVQWLGQMFASADAGAREIERIGFRYTALIVAILFVIFTIITCVNIKEKSTVDMKTAGIGDMFRSLIQNDQAMAVVVTIVVINCALYITSNLVIYFFKYDLGGAAWYNNYTTFNMVGGAAQILAMMVLYALLRKKFNNIEILYICFGASIAGYLVLLALATLGVSTLVPFLIPGILIMATSGVNNILVTVFLANTVDYGLVKNGRSDESVIFSMQTFVVKLASGIAAFVASITLGILNLSSEEATEAERTIDFGASVAKSSKMGLRMVMTLLPIAGLIFGIFWFRNKFKLTDEVVAKNAEEIRRRGLRKEQV